MDYFQTYRLPLAQQGLTGEQVKILTDAKKRVETTHVLDPLSIFVLGASIVLSISSGLNYFNSLKQSTKNIIAFIKPRDKHEKILIENTLRELLGISGGIRVVVGMFHNGSSIGSYHFNKLSVV